MVAGCDQIVQPVKGRGRPRKYCDAHRSDQTSRWAKENPEAVKRIRDRNAPGALRRAKARRAQNLIYLQILKWCRGCEECGDVPNGVKSLHWHHPDRRGDKRAPTKMTNCRREVLDAEIAKCVVLCDSCHGRVHYQDMIAALS